jgi:hypothetical protein
MIESLGKERDIDITYYNGLVDAAIDTLNKFGDFEQFVSEEPYITYPTEYDVPWFGDEVLDDMFSKR